MKQTSICPQSKSFTDLNQSQIFFKCSSHERNNTNKCFTLRINFLPSDTLQISSAVKKKKDKREKNTIILTGYIFNVLSVCLMHAR